MKFIHYIFKLKARHIALDRTCLTVGCRRKTKHIFQYNQIERKECDCLWSIFDYYDNIKMLSFYDENSTIMVNGLNNSEKKASNEYHVDAISKRPSSSGKLSSRTNTSDLIFFAGTDKARV